MGSVTIDRDQRNALWRDVILDLEGDDIGVFLRNRQIADAQEYRRRYERHFRLLDDIGWHEVDSRDTFTLTIPADELAAELKFCRERAQEELEFEQRQLGRPLREEDLEHTSREEWRAMTWSTINEDLDIISACDGALSQIEGAVS